MTSQTTTVLATVTYESLEEVIKSWDGQYETLPVISAAIKQLLDLDEDFTLTPKRKLDLAHTLLGMFEEGVYDPEPFTTTWDGTTSTMTTVENLDAALSEFGLTTLNFTDGGDAEHTFDYLLQRLELTPAIWQFDEDRGLQWNAPSTLSQKITRELAKTLSGGGELMLTAVLPAVWVSTIQTIGANNAIVSQSALYTAHDDGGLRIILDSESKVISRLGEPLRLENAYVGITPPLNFLNLEHSQLEGALSGVLEQSWRRQTLVIDKTTGRLVHEV